MRAQSAIFFSAAVLLCCEASHSPKAVFRSHFARNSTEWAHPAFSAQAPDTIGNFVIDGEYLCVQGPLRHMQFMLSLLKSSVLGGAHVNNRLELGTCLERGFDRVFVTEDGHAEDHCFPPAQLFYQERWIDDPTYGMIDGAGLLEAMQFEETLVTDLHDRAVAWPEDATAWPSLLCNCLDGSELQQQNLDLDEGTCDEWSSDLPVSFASASGLACFEAPLLYASRALATLRSSFASGIFVASRIEGMSCADRGFGGEAAVSEQSSCFPRARGFFPSEAERDAHEAELAEAARAYSSQHHGLLGNTSESAVLACSCVPGSQQREGLSDEEAASCADAAVASPVLEFWPQESML